MSGRLKFWVRCFIAAGAIVWVLSAVGLHEIALRLRGVPWPALVLVFSIAVIDRLARAFNWWRLLILLHVAPQASLAAVLRCYCSGGLVGAALPSTASTDAARALLAWRAFGG